MVELNGKKFAFTAKILIPRKTWMATQQHLEYLQNSSARQCKGHSRNQTRYQIPEKSNSYKKVSVTTGSVWQIARQTIEIILNRTGSIEFSLIWIQEIQGIQWIKTKSKSSIVTKDTLYLTIDTFLHVVVKKNFNIICRLVSVQSGEWQ